ncbi:hypothetical protein C8J57DRAFT_684456 [Mycena rebaudengoi]|nr:hypothetical protein C8J57DRAFT_684456 [Mycena rebaudengoi]
MDPQPQASTSGRRSSDSLNIPSSVLAYHTDRDGLHFRYDFGVLQERLRVSEETVRLTQEQLRSSEERRERLRKEAARLASGWETSRAENKQLQENLAGSQVACTRVERQLEGTRTALTRAMTDVEAAERSSRGNRRLLVEAAESKARVDARLVASRSLNKRLRHELEQARKDLEQERARALAALTLLRDSHAPPPLEDNGGPARLEQPAPNTSSAQASPEVDTRLTPVSMSPPSSSPPSPSILNSTSIASPTFPSPRPGPTQALLSPSPFVSTLPPPLTAASPAHRTVTSSMVARPSFARRPDLASTSASSSSSSSAPLPPSSTSTPAQSTRKHRREEDDNDDRPELEPVRRRTSPAPAPAPNEHPPQVAAPKAKGKLGIKHLDLLYEARGKTMHCRRCPRTFPATAAWAELLGHVQTEHADACAALETLSPGQVVEQLHRQRYLGSKTI